MVALTEAKGKTPEGVYITKYITDISQNTSATTTTSLDAILCS